MQGTASNYIMLLNSDNTGTPDSVYNNVYRFGRFTCLTADGCPDPSQPVPTFAMTSHQGTTIVPHPTIANPVWDGSSYYEIPITTTTLR